MKALLWNLVLALTWGAMTGSFEVENLLIGFFFGFVVLYVSQRRHGRAEYAAKVVTVVRFIGFYLWELLLANLRVAHDVVTPRHLGKPGIVAIPLDARTDAEITLVANLLTMTPGDLSLDVSSDRRVLYVHRMYLDDAHEVTRDIKEGFERRVLEVMR
ncbi:MAG TPA: Na+/H+ antiporter subunit E [Candidatus Limnocylindrales bacterium]|jgi:multicomponent Na+:H+ antiporter subunit E|nr:Na+/H+ antiporter subunit E [Candidatus Limnocylindrales bacterium]